MCLRWGENISPLFNINLNYNTMKFGEIVNKGIEIVKSIWTKEYSKWIRFGIITGLSITIAIYLTVISVSMLTLYILTTAY
jgi:hypothetical protein